MSQKQTIEHLLGVFQKILLESEKGELGIEISLLNCIRGAISLAESSLAETEADFSPKPFEQQLPLEASVEMINAGYEVLKTIQCGPAGGFPSWGDADSVFSAMVEVGMDQAKIAGMTGSGAPPPFSSLPIGNDVFGKPFEPSVETPTSRSENSEQDTGIPFLAGGARFKMAFLNSVCDECGSDQDGFSIPCFDGRKSELNGRWVALVDASDNQHLELKAPKQQTAPAPSWAPLPEKILSAEYLRKTGRLHDDAHAAFLLGARFAEDQIHSKIRA